MAAVTSADLLAQLRQYRLLDPAQLDELEGKPLAEFPKPKGLARELMRRGWLTPVPGQPTIQGRGKELVLGSYILIETLGEGGMGEVFKARNWKLRQDGRPQGDSQGAHGRPRGPPALSA